MPCMKKKNRKRHEGNGLRIPYPVSRRLGFTLIEMLIVSAILSVVALAIYATLNNGIKIWQKVNRQLPEEDLNIFFDKFALDIRNTFKFTGISFSGTIEKVEFPTLVNPVRKGGLSNGVNSLRLQKRTVGKLIYAYEPQNRILNRYQVDFAGIYSGESNASPQQSLRNVRTLKFQYYLFDEQNKVYLWQDEYVHQEGLPLAVRVELEFDDGKETKKFTKTVGIPTNG